MKFIQIDRLIKEADNVQVVLFSFFFNGANNVHSVGEEESL